MSKKTILIFFILYCFSASAQNADTLVYYIKELPSGIVPVSTKDSADFYRAIISPDTSIDKRLFIVNDFYKNGKPKMLANSTNRRYSITLSGVCIKFFENGHRKSVENYENNRLTGDVVEYYPNGKIYFTGKYNENNKLIVNECRDSTGKILAVDGDGRYIKYSSDFTNIMEEGWISNGQEDGEWRGRLNDSIKYICNYNFGKVKNGVGYDNKGNEYPFTNSHLEPQFPGGEDAFIGFLAKNIRYPSVAEEKKIQGMVFISFTVKRNGGLSDLKIVRSIGGGCDEEVIRVMKTCPPWIPGALYGIPVNIAYTIPVSFTLNRH